MSDSHPIIFPVYLRNHSILMNAFGYWPSFHDAQVINFESRVPSSVELILHGWEITREVDERGYFKLIKHHLIRFAFFDISEADLARFSKDNILFSLKFSHPEEFRVLGKFSVVMESVMGLDGSFQARSGEVVEVLPWDGNGTPIHSI